MKIEILFKSKSVILFGLLLTALPAILIAQSYEEKYSIARAEKRIAAFNAVEEGRFAEAVPQLEEMVADGFTRAIVQLAELYATGRGVDLDYIRATALFERALAAGADEVQCSLAQILESRARDSLEEAPDLKRRAAELFETTANAGDPVAMTRLGEALLSGAFDQLNPLLGAQWIQRAAQNSYSRAQLLLVELYKNGIGVPKDLVYAYAWNSVALAGIPLTDNETREQAIAVSNDLKSKLSLDQLNKAIELSHSIHSSLLFDSMSICNEFKL